MSRYSKAIAETGLEIKAIKLNPDNPFQWASGYMMPIYNDNRMFLFYYEFRKLIKTAFVEIINDLSFSIIAGTSTAGIPWGAILADEFGVPFIYVRDKPKDHGLRNQIEGIDAERDLSGQHAILIEDLISTGGSSAKSVQAIRDAKATCDYCISIFNYGLKEAEEIFKGTRPYDKDGKRCLEKRCNIESLLIYDTLIEVAKKFEYIDGKQEEMLAEWRTDPLNWGEKHGFPRVEKLKA